MILLKDPLIEVRKFDVLLSKTRADVADGSKPAVLAYAIRFRSFSQSRRQYDRHLLQFRA